MHSINNIKCCAKFTVFTRIYNDSVQHLTFRKYLHQGWRTFMILRATTTKNLQERPVIREQY
jgi:hypothetical protein